MKGVQVEAPVILHKGGLTGCLDSACTRCGAERLTDPIGQLLVVGHGRAYQ